jgi:hypothetical protein
MFFAIRRAFPPEPSGNLLAKPRSSSKDGRASNLEKREALRAMRQRRSFFCETSG